jgi:hypothetical protein
VVKALIRKDRPMFTSTKTVVISLVSILLFHVLAVFFGLYSYSWINYALHLLGGAWATMLFFLLFDHFIGEHAKHQTTEKIKILIIAVSFVTLLGVFWEAHEFLLSEYFSLYLQKSVGDVIGGILVDIFGGALAAIGILYLKSSSHKKIK